MITGRLAAAALVLAVLTAVGPARGQPALPVLDDKPIPQIDARGPSAAVLALAFADPDTLYSAGLDKVVRVWAMREGRFVLKAVYRVPLGPGNAGAVNAVALSPDGKWVAMAGRAPIRGEAGFRQGGVIVEAGALSVEQNRDAGVIYVAETSNPAGGKVLRGHRGEVRALAFAPTRAGKPPLLVSAATEREEERVFGGVRLWDIAAGRLLAERHDLPALKTRPGLAVWHTGAGATNVRIAIAWPETEDARPGYLRLWDPGPGADPLQRWKADGFTVTADLLGQGEEGAKILTGGSDPEDRGGRLRVWELSADRDTRALMSTAAEFPRRDRTDFRPVALTVNPATGGAPRHAAAILQPSVNADFRLALVDLSSRRVVADVPLPGSERGIQPAIAARGHYVAVAATSDHAIRLYDVGDLQEGKTEPTAVLASDGLAMRHVAFVDKGRGLWLSANDDARPLNGGFLFDFESRQLRANDRPDLATDTPDLGKWSFTIHDDRHSVRVRRNGEELPPVRLRGADQVVTAVALRPARAGQPGVLAVAYTERDAQRTLIQLSDPLAGKPYRLLVGHQQDVRELTFAASRPLLASVGDDQTVCVWGLADVDKAVGEIPGLSVVDGGGGKVVVRRVAAGSAAAAAALAEGDVLEKAGAPGAAKPVKNAAEFLLAVAARRPGDQAEVIVTGKGAVKLAVARGVDERKPLFSLFLLRKNRSLDWVGWSPAGPYDFSSPDGEKHLGWHANTGDPAAPASYAAASAYRKEYYREGILRYLAATADLSQALRRWDDDHPTVPPRPSLRPEPPDAATPGERAGEYRVRHGLDAVHVGINDDYALDDAHVLRWRLTHSSGKAEASDVASGVAPREGRQWRVDLSGVKWRRGEYRLLLVLLARANGSQLTSEAMVLRFQPPAPQVSLMRDGTAVMPAQALKSKTDRLDLEIAVQAPAEQEVNLRFAQSRNGLPVLADNVPAPRLHKGTGTLRQEFKLQEGLNRLVVQAVNRGAPDGQENEESASAEAWVSYQAPRELPPTFSALHLDSQSVQERQAGNLVWVVNQPTVRLSGKVEGEGVLVRVDWSAATSAPKSVLLAREGRVAEFATDSLELTPGEVMEIRLRAKSQHSDEQTEVRRIVFRPPLPTVSVDPLASPDIYTQKITLTGSVHAATEHPFAMRLRVTAADGRTATFEPVLDATTGRWKAEVSLYPGLNTVEAIVSNKWRGEKTGEVALKLRYLRPPRITAYPQKKEAVETNKVSLALTVEGPADRPLKAVRVDGKPVPFKLGAPTKRDDQELWPVELPEVFVNDGERNLDRLRIRAVSDEGDSPEVIVHIEHRRIPRPPSARFVRPEATDTVARPEYRVAYRVESERPLERVEIRRGDEVLYRADVAKSAREGTLHTLYGEADLTLTDGTNRLELVAVNADGRSPRAEIVVSYTPPAVIVTVDRVELRSERGELESQLTPVCSPDCEAKFPDASPRGFVWLVGRVRWSDRRAKELDDANLQVVARVGDCRQLPVALGPRGKGDSAGTRPFLVPLVLNGAVNRVRIDVSSVGQQESSRREFTLSCSAPVRYQRLHVLIVGVDVRDAEMFKNRFLDVLAVDEKRRPPGLQGEFVKDPPFQRCVLYRVLAGEVERGKVEAQLVEINKEITRLKNRSGWLNDLVLIYYQGKDILDNNNERWLLTSRNAQFPDVPPQEFAISCRALPHVPGTELLLLNVDGPPDPRPNSPEWGGDPDIGLMRYSYSGPSGPAKTDSVLLDLLKDGVRKKGNLGGVAKYVTDLVGTQPGKLKVVLNPDQATRQLHEPAVP